MTDVMTRSQRSRCMSRIRGKDTKPELLLRGAVWRLGLRYRVHGKIPGRPDLVFARSRVVVFVDGCFWHGCPLHGAKPKSNAAFWKAKLSANRQRDLRMNALLKKERWSVLRFWEHEVETDLERVIRRIHKRVLEKR